jgi:hypothetical protein
MNIDNSKRDFLASMRDEETPLQDCVSHIYSQWEQLRGQVPSTVKGALTKRMKFYQRVAAIDPNVLPILLAMLMVMEPD